MYVHVARPACAVSCTPCAVASPCCAWCVQGPGLCWVPHLALPCCSSSASASSNSLLSMPNSSAARGAGRRLSCLWDPQERRHTLGRAPEHNTCAAQQCQLAIWGETSWPHSPGLTALASSSYSSRKIAGAVHACWPRIPKPDPKILPLSTGRGFNFACWANHNEH